MLARAVFEGYTLRAREVRAEQQLRPPRLSVCPDFFPHPSQQFLPSLACVCSSLTINSPTLIPSQVKLLRRIGKDVLVIVPFVIILLIPLSPFGHVLVFGFIQRFFPDFYPSQFTEQRQNIMSMYSSITNSATLSIDAAVLRDGAAATGASAATSEAGADAEIAGAPNAAVQRNGATR